jgi:hypothetical protein
MFYQLYLRYRQLDTTLQKAISNPNLDQECPFEIGAITQSSFRDKFNNTSIRLYLYDSRDIYSDIRTIMHNRSDFYGHMFMPMNGSMMWEARQGGV